MNLSDESVAIVVVTFNSRDLLPGLLESLPIGAGEVDWHLVVADNASTDGSADRVRELAPDAIVVDVGRNAGYAGGINAGVAAAGPHSAVLVLNPDVRLGAGCLPILLEALRRPGTGIVVPQLRDGNSDLIESMRREPTILRALGDAFLGARRAGRYAPLGEVVTDHQLYDAETWTDWAEGSTQLVSRECWDRCGPWDESFFLYSEETDFDLRAGDAGLRTRYVPSARAVHLEGDSGSSPPLWALLVTNRIRLFRRRHGRIPSAAFWAVTLLRESSRAVLGKATSRAAVKALTSPKLMRQKPGPQTVRPTR